MIKSSYQTLVPRVCVYQRTRGVTIKDAADMGIFSLIGIGIEHGPMSIFYYVGAQFVAERRRRAYKKAIEYILNSEMHKQRVHVILSDRVRNMKKQWMIRRYQA